MAIQIRYRTLLTVAIWHQYFLNEGTTDWADLPAGEQERRLLDYRVDAFMVLRPARASRQALAGTRMRIVPTAEGFRIAGAVDATNQPIAGLPRQPIAIGLFGTDPYFYNYTALRLQASFHADPAKNAVRRVFHFITPDLAGGDPLAVTSLTQDIQAFNNATDYPAGDLVRSGGQLYEATADTNNTPPTDWQLVQPDRAYVSRADELRLRSDTFTYYFTQAGVTATLQVIDRQGQSLWQANATSTPDQLATPIDLRRLADGFYTLRVSDGGAYLEEQDFYLSREWYGSPLWGIIEILPDDLLGAGDEMIARPFEIRLHNRSTHWRYRSSRDQSEQTVQGAAAPLPLTANGRIETVLLGGKVLPSPNPYQILPDAGDAVIYSDVFIDETQF